MGSIWCVAPNERKVELVYEVHGDRYPFWIKIKHELNIGEDRRVKTAGMRGMTTTKTGTTDASGRSSEISVDFRVQSFARTEAYLTDWSLTDDKDKKLALDREVIETLHPDVYGLIEDAINVHIKEVEESKKANTGSEPPSAISA